MYICEYCSDAIKHVEFDENLKNLFQSHPKDFAIRENLAEIFIVQCDLTGKMETGPNFPEFFL